MSYIWHILVMINIYSVLAASLNLLAGYTGLLSLCHAAFFGVGAYATTLLMMKADLSFLTALVLAMGLAATCSLVIGLPTLRLHGDYFVLGTLAFQVIVFSLLYNSVWLTRGPYGIPGIPAPRLLGIDLNTAFAYFIFSGCLTLLSLIAIRLLVRSPFGRLLRAVRDDALATAALGKNVPGVKLTVFAIAAAMAATSGGLFAGYMRYIDPTSFSLLESIFIVSIVVIGGPGSLSGPIAGTALLIILPEALRFMQIPDTLAANLRQIIYGLLLVILMRLRPQGLLGNYRFD